jgi:hypothetical protein
MSSRTLTPGAFRHVENSHVTVEPGRVNPRRDTFLAKLGFNFRSRRDVFQLDESRTEVISRGVLRFPYWAMVLVTSAPALVAFLNLSCARWRRRRWKRGLCANCGYDLRASDDRCPECGTAKPREVAP